MVSPAEPPSSAFELRGWKLQLPGPREIRDLDGYSTDDFRLDAAGRIVFSLDAPAPGPTANSRFVRNELRHLTEWATTGPEHRLDVTVEVDSSFHPDIVTVAQIHGIGGAREHRPPLLRVVWQGDRIVAVAKTGNQSERDERVVLRTGTAHGPTHITITTGDGRLGVAVDDEPALEREVSWWPWKNYFKTGCYPQARTGRGTVRLSRLTVR